MCLRSCKQNMALMGAVALVALLCADSPLWTWTVTMSCLMVLRMTIAILKKVISTATDTESQQIFSKAAKVFFQHLQDGVLANCDDFDGAYTTHICVHLVRPVNGVYPASFNRSGPPSDELVDLILADGGQRPMMAIDHWLPDYVDGRAPSAAPQLDQHMKQLKDLFQNLVTYTDVAQAGCMLPPAFVKSLLFLTGRAAPDDNDDVVCVDLTDGSAEDLADVERAFVTALLKHLE
jgi:hypothetical protein